MTTTMAGYLNNEFEYYEYFLKSPYRFKEKNVRMPHIKFLTYLEINPSERAIKEDVLEILKNNICYADSPENNPLHNNGIHDLEDLRESIKNYEQIKKDHSLLNKF